MRIAKSSGLLLFLISAISLIAQSTGDLYKKYAPAVVLIETYGDDGKVNATGSGFIVASDGTIITNHHVVRHAKKATVWLENGDAYDDVAYLEGDRRKDIALIKIKAVDLPIVILGKSSAVQIGDTVSSVGNPLGALKNTLSSGIVSGIRMMDGFRFFQMSTPISHGSSGGPLFNAIGEVIGITTASISEGQNLNFAVPIDYAKGLLTSLPQPKPLVSIYEPEPETPNVTTAASGASAAEKRDAETATSSDKAEGPSEELRKQGPYVYLQTKFGQWSLADAKRELGSPVRETTSEQEDVYVFADPTNLFREITLFFKRTSKTMNGISLSPWNLSWRQAKETLGDRFWKTKHENGTVTYMYKDRPVNVLVDGREQVMSVGVFCNSCH